MQYNNTIPYYQNSMYMDNSVRQVRPRPGFGPGRPGFNNRLGAGGFLFPFALGFVSSPLIYGATRPRPYPYYGPGYGYFPYY